MQRGKTFTLVELLVVIAVIALLAGIIFPVLKTMRDRGRKTQCINNLRQIGQVVNAYVLTSGGRLPDCIRIGTGPDDPCNTPNTIAPDLKKIFHCPSDLAEKYEGKTYFGRYGTSYEWNAWLNGRLLDKSDIGIQQMHVWSPLFGDADYFHGGTIKNYLWADGRVDESGDPLIIQQ